MEQRWQLTDKAAQSLGTSRGAIEKTASVHGMTPGCVVVLRERDPRRFLDLFLAALERGCTLWLAAHDWGAERMRELESVSGPAILVGEKTRRDFGGARATFAPPQGSILIPTGGTSGRLRYAVHTWETLQASALGFAKFFGREGGHDTLCVLPLHHVGGLMQAVRVATVGGHFIHGNAHDPRSGLPDGFRPEGFFLSLVPTQLRRLIDGGAADWLRRFETIHIGGSALDAALAEKACAERLPLAPSYGMTETAAVICSQRPSEFLAGAKGVGHPLPHAQITVETDTGAVASQEYPGRIRIRATSLCKELTPTGANLRDGLLTNDLGWFDASGRLHVRGRADRVIVSGGQKIEPAEIEAVLLGSGLVRDAAVAGVPDAQWGQAVVAFYVPADKLGATEADLRTLVREKLSPAHVPKLWNRLAELPRNAAGKLDMSGLTLLVAKR